MLMSRLRRLASDERGIALVMALGMLIVLAISIATLIYFTSANSRSATSSKESQHAYFLAEAGVNNAFAILAKQGNNALDPYQLCPDGTATPSTCLHTDTFTGDGTVTWVGTLTQPPVGTTYWTIKSTGYVRNPTNASKQLRRTIVATVAVVPTPSQQLNNAAWNYIFVRAPGWSGQALNGCDMTLQQSVNVESNLYVMGNLCFQNTASMTKGELWVLGSVDQQQNANHVGAQGADLPMAHVKLGCRFLNQDLHSPCQYGAGGGHSATADNVWANPLDSWPSTLGTITPPTADFNGWYLNASPGPYFPCNAPPLGHPAVPTFRFDNPVGNLYDSDATRLSYKNDNQGIANLTPGTSYECKTSGGELSWDATSRILTISGTVYIDGSAQVTNGLTNLYKGSGTIYLSGTFLMKGGGANTQLCPYSAWNGSSCNVANWDTRKDLLGIIVAGNGSIPADSQNSAVPSGVGAEFQSAYLAGAVWAANMIDIGSTALVDGPLDGSYVNLGQASNSTFSGFTFVPASLPGETPVYAEPQAPTFAGG
jgi:Tfp pilus assembly protein PilX